MNDVVLSLWLTYLNITSDLKPCQWKANGGQ